jgi:hypothetical protein
MVRIVIFSQVSDYLVLVEVHKILKRRGLGWANGVIETPSIDWRVVHPGA